jgi:hypothetical protein
VQCDEMRVLQEGFGLVKRCCAGACFRAALW